MFQDSLVESSGQLKSKSSRYLWMTASFNAAIVGVMILIPLLYPEALPKTALAAMLTAPPPPPPAPPPAPRPTARPVQTTARLDPFTAPPSIPTHIDNTHEDPPPQEPTTGVVGMTNTGVSGALSAMNTIAPGVAPVVVKPTPIKPNTPTNVSGGVMAGQIISKTTPVYPPIARAAHISGAVVLHAIISKTGTIQSLSVISGPEMLRSSAVNAVQQWRYKPYLLSGEPTDVETTITVNFSFGG